MSCFFQKPKTSRISLPKPTGDFKTNLFFKQVVDVPKKTQQTNGVTRIVMGQDGVMQQAVLQQQQ